MRTGYPGLIGVGARRRRARLPRVSGPALGPGVCALLCLAFAPSPAAALSSIAIVDGSRALVPNQSDYEAGYVESTAPPGGILVRVTTDNPAGVILYVRCEDASPAIALADLLVKCPTSGAILTSYTPIAAGDQALWSSAAPATDQDVNTDIRVANLWAYADAGGAGTSDYVNTITYTVVEP